MKRLLSILLASIMLLAIVAIGPAAGAVKKYIYEADVFDMPTGPGNPVNLIVISYAHVTIDPDFNVEFNIKTDQLNSRLGASMMEGFGPYRHSVYLGQIVTDAEGNGKATFSLKAANIDYQVPGRLVIEPSFRLFSFKWVTDRPNALEAASVWPVYPLAPPPDKGKIVIRTVLPSDYEGPAPCFDLSWLPDPMEVILGVNCYSEADLMPRYYGITRHDLPGLTSRATIENLGSGDSFQLGTREAWDRTLIVNLAPGEVVTVTYTYTHTY